MALERMYRSVFLEHLGRNGTALTVCHGGYITPGNFCANCTGLNYTGKKPPITDSPPLKSD